jgi:hypothetical protein
MNTTTEPPTVDPAAPLILFRLGRLMMTPGARDRAGPELILDVLKRHAAGDWSDMSADDQDANRAALVDGGRIFSAYNTTAGRLWVITEADDRDHTTVLLPEEY